MHTYHAWRIAATAIGIGAASLGCYGAYEFAYKLEGQVSYLVIAAPLIAAMAALIPPMAEGCWRMGDHVKAALWWLALVPAVAVVFYSAAERVHVAKSGSQAELTAYYLAATRARDALGEAKTAAASAQAEADKTRSWKTCGPQCVALRDTAEARRQDVSKAELALLQADKLNKQDAPLQAPVWLLPAALDLVAFMAIWTGLGGPWWTTQQPLAVPVKVRRKKAKRPSVAVPRGKLRVITRNVANDTHVA